MTAQEFADYLNKDKKRETVTCEECNLAYESGLVMVYGFSDDLMEFEGSICDEVGCWNGGIAYLDESGVWVNECEDDDCPYAMRERAKCKAIWAIWHDEGNPCWTYETDIPHATFDIYDDGELWCEGIVFAMSSLSDNDG